jgi:hypothetical protein
MKTPDLNLRNLSITISFLFFGTSLLSLTGCQKDELSEMTSAQLQENSKVSLQEESFSAIAKQNSSAKTFTMLVIDHSSAQTNLPSYKLELQENGTGLFTGRKNTAILGSKKIFVTGEMIQQIKEIMRANKFETLENRPFVFDLPIVSTTFRKDKLSEAITKLDYNESDKSNILLVMRETIEQMLGISRFVKTGRSLNGQQLNMDHLQN